MHPTKGTKIFIMNIPPKTSLPKSSINFPMFSLNLVCFFGFFLFLCLYYSIFA
jgi:hypothetical protein